MNQLKPALPDTCEKRLHFHLEYQNMISSVSATIANLIEFVHVGSFYY